MTKVLFGLQLLENLAHDAGADHEHEEVKALTTDELAAFLNVCPEHWRAFLQVLAATGLRVSEAFALRWRDLMLDGSQPHVRVRRAYVRGRFGAPTSRHGRRVVPIDHELVTELRARRRDSEWSCDEDLVFCARNGAPLRQENVHRRALKPTAEETGVPWAGFSTFRHTCATRMFAEGRNAVQVSRWLGHHSPAFTLSVYVHLLDGDLGAPLASSPIASRRTSIHALEGASDVSAEATDSREHAAQHAA